MKTVLKIIVMIVAGTFIGAVSTSAILRIRGYQDIVKNSDSWMTARGIGSQDADPTLKAIIAIIGIFANSKEEAIYLQAYQGCPLYKMKGNRHYKIEGNVHLPANWWSITLYNQDEFLFDNPDHRYSYTNFNVKTDDKGNFTIDVAPRKPEGATNWLPSPPSGPISLTFRIYEPEKSIYQHLGTYPLPRVREVL